MGGVAVGLSAERNNGTPRIDTIEVIHAKRVYSNGSEPELLSLSYKLLAG